MDSAAATGAGRGLRHEALFHSGLGGFLAAAVPFVRSALERDDDVVLAVGPDKAEALLAEVGVSTSDRRLQLADARSVGANPARLIPFWLGAQRAAGKTGRGLCGIGEPVWPSRSAAEIEECDRYEVLTNLALAAGDLWLVCAYDTDLLAPEVAEEARRSHPLVNAAGVSTPNDRYGGDALLTVPGRPLAPPPAAAEVVPFTAGDLAGLRELVSRRAEAAGIEPLRVAHAVLAVNEVTTNSIAHAGGRGTLRLWREPAAFVCEVSDSGTITDPMVGRVEPSSLQEGGRGLWLVNQLCDLVQIRSGPAGTVVRMHLRRG